MAFIPAKRPIVAAPVSIKVHAEDGSIQDLSFVAHYRRATRQELIDLNDGLMNRARASLGQPPIERPDGTAVPEWPYQTDDSLIRDRMVGWHGVDSPSGGPLAFSADELDTVMSEYPELARPLFDGFFAAHQGAREKN